jgi:hypothetical protein
MGSLTGAKSEHFEGFVGVCVGVCVWGYVLSDALEGIKVGTGLQPIYGTGETLTQGLDGLADGAKK